MEVPGGDGVLRSLRAVDVLSAEGSPSIKAVAAQLGIEASTASRLVVGAERSGFLTKQPSDDDLRRSELALTPRGSRLLTRSSSRRRDLLAEATAGWTRDEVDCLAKLLDRLADGLEALADEL
ncbi:MarR family winged helix-turn-helix transcriptional regulator [Nocardioides sp. 31GB23]|uniref:MarR family winged helix-turn-helix transcriptional regulator n=1 Tax=Nocardioides sp. 31GB23 TaxID=3156065 RepID=UPI0032AF2216